MDFNREIERVYCTLRAVYGHDLAAEAITRALEHRDRYNPKRSSLFVWCRAIARNLWINDRRRSSRAVSLYGVVAGGIAPDMEAEAAEVLSLVRRLCATSVAIDTLFEFAHGYSIAEVAQRRGVPPGTVKRRIHDGRKMLKQKSWFYEWAS